MIKPKILGNFIPSVYSINKTYVISIFEEMKKRMSLIIFRKKNY